MSLSMIRRAVVTCLVIGAPSTLSAQGPRALTSADYARAERFLAPTTSPLVFGAGVRPNWLSAGDDRFWYRTTTPAGVEFILIDPAHGTRSRAFDQANGQGACA